MLNGEKTSAPRRARRAASSVIPVEHSTKFPVPNRSYPWWYDRCRTEGSAMRGWCAWMFGFVCCAVPALGAPHEVQLPLREGKLPIGPFTATICREMHLPQYHPSGQLDLSGP